MTKDKLVTKAQLHAIITDLRGRGKKIAWTNGCFDFMHAGHVSYLQKSRSYGDVLVVGMNSDASVKKLKGDLRPICPEQERALVLSALIYVDYIIIFEERSPVNIIQEYKPDFYIKGGDYTIDTIDQTERRVVEGYGGEIILLPEVAGISTSIIIEKIKRL
ncbi:MAG: D-glycero-beta-D-manno-heptose 1-phosphate adenylyltransferase [Candidatus Zhuqueibacterota bacterium]